LTENRNRTAADVRNIFSKSGGNLGETGCVGWLFERKGLLLVLKEKVSDEETFMMEIIDAGAEDIEEDDGIYEIKTNPSDFMAVKNKLDALKIEIKSAELTYVPKTTVEASKKDAEKVLRLINNLDDHDDIQNVYSNIELTEELLQEVGKNPNER